MRSDIDQSRDFVGKSLCECGADRFVSFGGIVVASPEEMRIATVLQEKGLFSLIPLGDTGQRVRSGWLSAGLEGILAANERKSW